MKLSQLLLDVSHAGRRGPDPDIRSICADSRDVQEGALFVAVPGLVTDGHAYIDEAVRRGASALLLQRDHVDAGHLPAGPLAVVTDTRAALAAVAAAFHRHPAGQLRVIGVTGTDGKTTVCYLINAILEQAGYGTGLIGTVDFKVGDRWLRNDTRLTTPGSPEVQALLAASRDAGASYAILESTSHGLELRRLDCCQYDAAVFTNLSPDHLDQHGTIEAYRAAKGRLFAMLGEPSQKIGPRYAVLNMDDPNYKYFHARSEAPAISYGFSSLADVRAEEVVPGAGSTRFTVRGPNGNTSIDLPLPGLFNVSNALAAVAVGLREGIDMESIVLALERLSGVPGRMEWIDSGQPFGVIVDYAHTGEALHKVLSTLRPGTRGRIIAVFGSAGERGQTRRSGMARAAAELADHTILTDEDPRSEDPAAIVDEMAATLRDSGRCEPDDFERVLDRQAAIDAAVARAEPGDLVLIAGKGHEQSIERRGDKLPWDDRAAARRALAGLGFGRDP